MKKFFTTTFACVLGVMIAGILLTLLSIGRINRNGRFRQKPNTQRNQTLS